MTTTILNRLEIGIECVSALIGACFDEQEAIDNEVGLEILKDRSPTDVFVRKLQAVRNSMELQQKRMTRQNNEDGS